MSVLPKTLGVSGERERERVCVLVRLRVLVRACVRVHTFACACICSASALMCVSGECLYMASVNRPIFYFQVIIFFS